MKKRKGWSAVNFKIPEQLEQQPVEAAASVPSSFTSTKALWGILDKKSLLLADMPVPDKTRNAIKKYIYIKEIHKHIIKIKHLGILLSKSQVI